MEFLLHHLIGRYVINLPAIGCLVAGMFGVGIVSLFLPISVPANHLIIAIVPMAAVFATIAEAFRVKARLFVGIPFAWVGYAVLVWFCYSIWSFGGLVASALVLATFWGIILGLSHFLDVWEWDRAQYVFQLIKKSPVRTDQVQVWIDVSKVWFAPRFRHRSRTASHHNCGLIEWMLQNLSAHLNSQETILFTRILDQLSIQVTDRKLRKQNSQYGVTFSRIIDQHLRKTFGKRLHASFRITSPS